MPVGPSGRIVVEFDPELKRRLHARLRSEGRDFKAWLLERVQEYLSAPQESEGEPRDGEEPPSELGEVEKRVLEAVSSDARGGRNVDQLMEATGLGIGEIRRVLLELELHGRVVERLGLYRCARPS